MPRVVQFFWRCLRCGRKYKDEEHQALKTTRVPGGKTDWPTCKCGHLEFKLEDYNDDD